VSYTRSPRYHCYHLCSDARANR